MDCWICVHGSRANADQVGTCISCGIFACDDHGDRTKGRFWCHVCMQKIALGAAGFPVMPLFAGGPGPEGVADEFGEFELTYFMGRFGDRYDAALARVTDRADELRDRADGRDVDLRWVATAVALAEGCARPREYAGGGMALAVDVGVGDVVDERIVDFVQ